jgi:outer membrane protein
MMNNKKFLLRAAAAAALAAVSVSAQAQAAGTWLLSGGVTHIAPNTSSGTLSPPAPPNTTVDIGPDTKPTLAVGRMLTDNWSVEVPIGFGFKHSITGTGGIAGVGEIGTVKALPVSVFGQYRFLEPGARFRPYVMLGLTYAYFYDEAGSATLNALNPINPPGGTTLKVDSKFGLTPGLGVTARVADRWYVEFQYAHSFLKTTTTLNSGQRIATKLDPDAYRLSVGYMY